MDAQPTLPHLYFQSTTRQPIDAARTGRCLLPQNLCAALMQLNDFELSRLASAVKHESERRGRALEATATEPATSCRPRPDNQPAASLTRGQTNVVLAAFRAGVKPAAIARQFRLSQADVRKALASGA